MATNPELKNSNFKTKAIYIILGVCTFCWPILIFGKAYFYFDTIDYTKNASDLSYVSLFRSTVGYALFIKLTSLHTFRDSVPIFQSLILVLLLRQLIFCLHKKISEKQILIAIIILCLFTIVDQLTATIMPDVFTPILLLSYFLLSIENERWKKNTFGLIFSFSIITHNIHTFISIALVAITILYKRVNRYILIYLLLGIAFVPAWYLVIKGNIYPHKSGAKFLAVLVEGGLLKKYLAENCIRHPHYLCKYQDILPEKAGDFAWNKKWLKKTKLLKLENLDPLIIGIIKYYPIESAYIFSKSVYRQSFKLINIFTFSIGNALKHKKDKSIKYESKYFTIRGLNKIIYIILLIYFLKKNSP